MLPRRDQQENDERDVAPTSVRCGTEEPGLTMSQLQSEPHSPFSLRGTRTPSPDGNAPARRKTSKVWSTHMPREIKVEFKKLRSMTYDHSLVMQSPPSPETALRQAQLQALNARDERRRSGAAWPEGSPGGSPPTGRMRRRALSADNISGLTSLLVGKRARLVESTASAPSEGSAPARLPGLSGGLGLVHAAGAPPQSGLAARRGLVSPPE